MDSRELGGYSITLLPKSNNATITVAQKCLPSATGSPGVHRSPTLSKTRAHVGVAVIAVTQAKISVTSEAQTDALGKADVRLATRHLISRLSFSKATELNPRHVVGHDRDGFRVDRRHTLNLPSESAR